jgi:hypothetical protein
VQVTDGRRKYARAPVDDNMPLSMWSNRWSTMPVHRGLEDYMKFPNPDRRATLDFMPGSDVPVIRQPFEAGDTAAVLGRRRPQRRPSPPLRPRRRPRRAENRHGEATLESEMIDLLRTALVDVDAPDEQLVRLGIA